MKRPFKFLMLFSWVALILSCTFSEILASSDVNMKVGDKVLSADLKRVTLRAVFERLTTEKGIRIKGDEKLLEEQVSVQFSELPLDKGLRRILAPMNYMILFDLNGRPANVNVIGKKALDAAAQKTAVQAQPSAASPPVTPTRPFPVGSQPPKLPQEAKPAAKTTVVSGQDARAAQAEPAEREKDSEEIPPGFKVIPGVAPPAKPKSAALSQSQAKKFEVIENAPPPGTVAPSSAGGGTGQSASGGTTGAQLSTGSQPPGGPVKVTEEEKALFSATKKRTPPAP